MVGRCDGRPQVLSTKPANLQQIFKIATWNVRGLRPKVQDLAEALKNKDVDICGLQETKCDAGEQEFGDYNIITFNRDCKHHGLGFAIHKGIEITKSEQVTNRIAYIILQKKQSWSSKKTR